MKGITVIELVVVIAIIAILAGIALGPGQKLVMTSKVREAAAELLSDLEETRRRSITEIVPYGISVRDDLRGYVVFRDNNRNCTYDPGEEINQNVFDGGVVFEDQLVLVWDRKGTPRNDTCGFFAGTFSLGLNSFTKEVVIDRLGRIRVE